MRPSFAHDHDASSKMTRPRQQRGSGAPKGACQPFRANLRALRPVGTGAAARFLGARSPSGALLRHSPGRTHPPLAQLQFPRFLRPDLAGVTRFDLSRVYRAPRRPVVLPVERWPKAAWERMANPPAGTALAPPLRHAFRKGALNERGDENVTKIGTNVKSCLDNRDQLLGVACGARCTALARGPSIARSLSLAGHFGRDPLAWSLALHAGRKED
jgi:hypothetical protein